MKFEVNITKIKFFVILGVVLILAGAIVVYAWGTNNPAVFGHSAGEIEGVCHTNGDGCPSGVGGSAVSSVGSTYHYITPVVVFNNVDTGILLGSATSHCLEIGTTYNSCWKSVSYSSISSIPTTAKTIIVRMYVKPTSVPNPAWTQYVSDEIITYMQDTAFPAQEVTHSYNTEHENIVLQVPYSSDKAFDFTCRVSNYRLGYSSNDPVSVYVIGYTD